MTSSSTISSSALRSSRDDRARCLDAMHEVERLAAAPGPLRPDSWRDDLLDALHELGASFHAQHVASTEIGSLLSRVTEEAPHLIPSVDDLMARQRVLDTRVSDLRSRLADLSRPFGVEETRGQLAEITRDMRELRAWETDLVYEAYSVDLGVAD